MIGPVSPVRSADPVRLLLHRHGELCRRAVDPLEIAAALEAHGITDRTAARFRHRDVFSLAEELYARTPRDDGPPAAAAPAGSVPEEAVPEGAVPEGATARQRPARRRIRWARAARTVLLPVLPGGLCAAAFALPLPVGLPPAAAGAVMAVAAAAVASAVALCLRGTGATAAAVLACCWLTGHVLLGDRLPAAALGGAGGVPSPSGPLLSERCLPLGLALAVAPAVWCARWFAARARRQLAAGRSLAEFAARTRPALTAAVSVFAAALPAALAAAHAVVDGGPDPLAAPGGDPAASATPLVAAAALGMLLFTALLLSAHGFARAATRGLAAACVLQVAGLATALAARLPALEPLSRPVRALVEAWGPAAVSAAACACAALALLAVAAGSLTGASAHHRSGP